MKKCGIYGIHNVANGKWYVGQSLDLTRRKSVHFSALRGGYHRNLHFQNSFIKYGESSFEFRILEEVPEDMLDVRERAWISFYKSIRGAYGYNLETGGNVNKHFSEETRLKLGVARKGKHHSVETRAKISESNRRRPVPEKVLRLFAEANKNRIVSEKSRQSTSARFKGKSLSAEHRAKIAVANKGKVRSEEAKKKISDAHKGMKASEEARAKMSLARKGKPMPKITYDKWMASRERNKSLKIELGTQ